MLLSPPFTLLEFITPHGLMSTTDRTSHPPALKFHSRCPSSLVWTAPRATLYVYFIHAYEPPLNYIGLPEIDYIPLGNNIRALAVDSRHI